MPVEAPVSDPSPHEITPELVQIIADRVYAMWLKEWQIENERRRVGDKKSLARRIK